jgi:hypothetical protein
MGDGGRMSVPHPAFPNWKIVKNRHTTRRIMKNSKINK